MLPFLLLQVSGLEILGIPQYPGINLGFGHLSRGFEVIWLLPRGLLGLSVVVISSSIRGFVLRPRGFLGEFQAKLIMKKKQQQKMGSNRTKSGIQTCLEWSSLAELVVVELCWTVETTGCVVCRGDKSGKSSLIGGFHPNIPNFPSGSAAQEKQGAKITLFFFFFFPKNSFFRIGAVQFHIPNSHQKMEVVRLQQLQIQNSSSIHSLFPKLEGKIASGRF